MANNSNNPFTAAAQAVEQVKPDSEFTEAARSLASRSVELAQFYLDNGSPQMQLQVIKTIMPAIGRSLNTQGESEELALMRQDLAALHQAIMGQSLAS